jgi:hypothetical protein
VLEAMAIVSVFNAMAVVVFGPPNPLPHFEKLKLVVIMTLMRSYSLTQWRTKGS